MTPPTLDGSSHAPTPHLLATAPRDFISGIVVFLVALPLCLGVALASGAPLFSGLLAGIVGGIVVGMLSGSHTSVAGPAAGLTAVVAAQIASLGDYRTFLLAVMLAGVVQIALGLFRMGFIASYFPSNVIKGLLAAIGVILILKQLPHLFGDDRDPEGDMAFIQPDHETTFSELGSIFTSISPGATAIGLASLAVLIVWDRVKFLKKSIVPAPLVVVLMGVGLAVSFRGLGSPWAIASHHFVQVPVADSLSSFLGFLQTPNFAAWGNPAVYLAALTIAAVASLETLLNLEAVDKIDPQQRNSPPNRELLAQGVGNTISGLIGGLPVTSVIVRSSVNIHAGARTKLSAIVHGVLLLTCVALVPTGLNLIPLSCLAAILLMTGYKLISPALVKQMWDGGPYQFLPFAVTVVAIVLTDLLIGIGIGLGVSLAFILHSNMRRPMRRYVERHLGGDVLHIVLANQVSFLNRAPLSKVLDEIPRGGKVLLDAQNTDYIDPDVQTLIRDFKETTGPARGIGVSLLGFRSKYELVDTIQYVDYSTREVQQSMTPGQVLQILKDGNERFRTNKRLTRDLGRQMVATSSGQHPLAVVLSCIDSRSPAELILDQGLGDIFSVRVAGNVSSRKVLGSIEYGCAVAGAKLVLVVGHTRCGAVTAAVRLLGSDKTGAEATGCQHIDHIVEDIQPSTDARLVRDLDAKSPEEQQKIVDEVARRNVLRVVRQIREQSETLDRLVREGKIAIVGSMYDVSTGAIEFLAESSDILLSTDDALETASP